MSEGRRPGGLTALAVLNFLGSVVALINGVSMFFTPAALPHLIEQLQSRDDKDAAVARQMFEEMLQGVLDLGAGWYVLSCLALSSAPLLIASGIGYLQQRRFLGRTLGNVWASLSIVTTILSATVASQAMGGVTILIALAVVYPLLTLILINGTFKEDFVR